MPGILLRKVASASTSLFVVTCLSACASSPAPHGADETTPVAKSPVAADSGRDGHACRPTDPWELVKVDLDGALLRLGGAGGGDALLKSVLSVGVAADSLRYEATYSLERGDVLAVIESDIRPTTAPNRLSGQNFGQSIEMKLPELAGSPLSLGITSNFKNEWLVSGYSESQYESADLEWSPGRATVDVEWFSNSVPFSPSAALTCDLKSRIQLPTHEGSDHSERLSVTGGKCSVAGGDMPSADLTTRTYGLHYEWRRPQGATEAVLQVIDLEWERSNERWDVDPGYELGFSHRRDFGPLSAKAVVLLRQALIWEHTTPGSELRTVSDASWATNTSLTWKLPQASLTATWAKGEDRLWFTPDVGQRRDRLGLAVSLSEWMKNFAPDASPKLAMNWNWSREYLPREELPKGSSSVSLDIAMMF